MLQSATFHENVRTPLLLLSSDKLDRNIWRFQSLVAGGGKALRVHAKGHRTVEVARRQVAAGAVGVVVQTTPEARAYLQAGVRDLVLSRPVLDPWRWPLVVDLAAEVGRLDTDAVIAVAVANAESVVGLAAGAVPAGVELRLRIDVKFDRDRGIEPERVGDLARLIERTDGVVLDGVAGYRSCLNVAETRQTYAIGSRLAATLCGLADAVRADGIRCPVVSVSGTPNVAGALQVPGVTEICAGAGPLFDAGFASVGLCAIADVAVAIRTTVVDVSGKRVRTDADHLLVDAYQPWDPSTVATMPDGTALRPDGVRVGQVIDLLPAHICPVAMHDEPRTVVDGSGRLIDRWMPVLLPEVRP